MIYDTRRYTQSIKLSIRKDGGQRYKTNTIFVCVWKYYAVLQVVTSMVLEPFSLVAWTCWFMGLLLCPDTSWLWWEMVIVCLSWNCHFSCCVSFMPFFSQGGLARNSTYLSWHLTWYLLSHLPLVTSLHIQFTKWCQLLKISAPILGWGRYETFEFGCTIAFHDNDIKIRSYVVTLLVTVFFTPLGKTVIFLSSGLRFRCYITISGACIYFYSKVSYISCQSKKVIFQDQNSGAAGADKTTWE